MDELMFLESTAVSECVVRAGMAWPWKRATEDLRRRNLLAAAVLAFSLTPAASAHASASAYVSRPAVMVRLKSGAWVSSYSCVTHEPRGWVLCGGSLGDGGSGGQGGGGDGGAASSGGGGCGR